MPKGIKFARNKKLSINYEEALKRNNQFTNDLDVDCKKLND